MNLYWNQLMYEIRKIDWKKKIYIYSFLKIIINQIK